MPALAPIFFTSLATALEAGMALEQVLANPQLSALWPVAARPALRHASQHDGLLGSALRKADLVDDAVASLLDAGAVGGFLPRALRSCGELLERRRQRRRRLLLALAYPAFVMLAASVLLPLPTIVAGGVGAYLRAALPGVAVIVGVLLVVFVMVPRLPPSSQARLGDTLARLPGVGRILVDDAVAGVLSVLQLLLAAGVPVTRAVQQALQSSSLSRHQGAGQRAVDVITAGGTLSDALAAAKLLRGEALARVAMAEQTGTLDAALPQLSAEHTSRSAQRFGAVAVALGGLVFAGAAIAIAGSVISGFSSYIETIDSIGRE